MTQDSPRREFLKAGCAALTTSIFTGSLRGANDKPNLAFIGCGRMGVGNMGFAAQAGGLEITDVCDVYQPALERARAQARRLGFTAVKAHRDFREILSDPSIDAVAIATPDHWHAWLTVEACKAGKDVWCESPACVYVEEGVKMVQAARKYGRVVQAGTIQRSGAFFQKARAIVRSGAIGEVTFCSTFPAGGARREGPSDPADSDPPAAQERDLWPGPVPERPLSAHRWDTDLLDIVQSAFDEAMPLAVTAQKGTTMLATFRYPGFLAAYEGRAAHTFPYDNAASGTVFHGTDATLVVNGDGYWVWPASGSGKPFSETSRDLAAANVAHWKNFVECLRSRRKPAADIEACVRSTATCLLADLALRHNVTLDWDAEAFTVKQQEIQPYLKATYRSPWKLEV